MIDGMNGRLSQEVKDMYNEISNPMDYHVALYIRLSKEDESEGPSQSVTNQNSLLDEFVKQHRLSVYDTYIDDTAIMGLNQNPVQTGVDLVPFFFLSALFSANEGVPA